MASNIAVYYRFDTDDVINNTMRNAITGTYDATVMAGTITTANYFIGKSALNIDAILTQYLTMPSSLTIPQSGFSMAFWLSSNNITNSNATIFEFANTTDNFGTGKYALSMGVNSNSQLVFTYYNNSGTASGTVTSTTAVNDTIWRHVLLTFTSSTNIVSLYINGKLNARSTFSNYPFSTTYTTSYIGRGTQATPYYYTGSIDDFRIYSYAITSEDDINYLLYYPNYNIYTTSPSQAALLGNTISNFYDMNNVNASQIYSPRTILPGTILLVSGRPNQNFDTGDLTAISTSYILPSYCVFDTTYRNLYVCDKGANELKIINMYSGVVNAIYTHTTVHSVAFDVSNINYYLTGQSYIPQIDLSTNTLQKNINTNALINTNFVLTDNSNNIFISHATGIAKINLSCSLPTATSTVITTTVQMAQMCFKPSSQTNIYAIDASNTFIYVIDKTTNANYKITLPASLFTNNPNTNISGLVFDSMDNVYVGGVNGNNNIYIIPYYVINAISTNTTLTADRIVLYAGTSSFGYSGDGGPCINAQFMSISNLSIDAGNNLYICDSGSYTIRKIINGGARKTNFMNMIANETNVVSKTASDLKTVYSGVYSIGGSGASASNYSNYGINNTSTVIETELQASSFNNIDNSGQLIYYKFNTMDTSGIQVSNYSLGMPLFDASMSDTTMCSTNDYIIESGGLNMIPTSIGTWSSIDSLPISSLLLPNNPSGFDRHGMSFGSWNGVAVSKNGLYVAGVGDFHNFYTNYNTNYNLFSQLYTVPTVELVGGTGTAAYAGDGGPVSKAQFLAPLGEYVFTPNGYYIANSNNIRFVNNQSIIRTACGSNTASSTGNFGLATSATINNTYSIFQDVSLNYLYLSEYSGNVVRRIDNKGIIYPFCGTGSASSSGDGGVAISATINNPWGILTDTSNNVYVCEDTGHRIRMIDFSTNIISKLAGTGTAGFFDNVAAEAAQFNRPLKGVLDLSRNLYIADYNNNRIRKITAVNGVLSSSCIVSTICGTGTASSTGDGRLATLATLNFPLTVSFNSDYSYLYIFQDGIVTFRAINMKSGIINTVFGTGIQGTNVGNQGNPLLATTNLAYNCSFDPSNNIYFGTSTAVTYLRRLTSLTSFPPFAKQPYDRVWALYGLSWKYISMSGTGQYQIAYMNNFGTYLSNGYGSINTWDYIADLSGIYTNSAALSYTGQYQSVMDLYGNIYVSSAYGANSSWTQRFVNTRNTNFTPMPAKIACSFDGKYQVATAFRHQQCVRIVGTGTPGFSGDNGQATAAQFNYQLTFRFDSSNNMIFADGYNHRVRRIATRTGIITTIVGTGTGTFPAAGGTATAVSIAYPFGLIMDISNNYYIANYHGLVKVTGTTLAILGGSNFSNIAGDGAVLSNTTRFASPQGLCCDSFNNIYLSDNANRRIRKITATTNFVSTICGTGTTSSTGDGGLASAATLNPVGICCDSFNNLYITDTNRIRKIDVLSGIITTICGTGVGSSTGDGGPASSATISTPLQVCVDRANNLYISEYGNGTTTGNRVRKITAINGELNGTCIITTYAGNGTQVTGGDNGLPTQVGISVCTSVSIDPYDNVYFNNNQICVIYKATQYANVIVSSNYGQTWSDVTTNITGNIAFNNVATSQTGQYMTATSLNGRIYRSTNFGVSGSWSVSSSTIDNWGSVVVSNTGQYQIAAGYDMGGFYSTDFGVNWTANGMPNGNWSSLALSESTNTLYAVSQNAGASGSTIYKNIAFNLPTSGLNSEWLTIHNPVLKSANWPTINGVSFSFWCKSKFNTSMARFFDFGNGGSANNIVMTVSSNNIYFSVYNGATGNDQVTNIQINDNIWRHVCWTLTYASPSATNSIYTIYINGINVYQQSNQTFTIYPNATARQFCYIGRSNWSNDPYFNGVIDDFRVYNRVLSNQEVFKLYSANECAHYYKFDSDYDFTNTQLANYNTVKPAYDGTQYTQDPNPPIITTATTVAFGTYSIVRPSINNLYGMALTQNNKRMFTIANNTTTFSFSDYNINLQRWNTSTNVTITSGFWTGIKASADGYMVVMCAATGQSVAGGLFYSVWNGTTYSALTTIAASPTTNPRFYSGIELTANRNRLIAIADYVYFATWNEATSNFINLTATALAIGSSFITYDALISQKYNMCGGIACNADGSRIAYANTNNEIYFASWNGTTYVNPVLIADLDPYATGMTMSYDGNLLFYSNVSDFSQKIFYSIWNGTTYSVQTELSYNLVSTTQASTTDGLPQFTPAATLYMALSYDMSTLYISTNSNSAYRDIIAPRNLVGIVYLLPLIYTNTSTMTKRVGTNSLVVQRQNTMTPSYLSNLAYIPYFTPSTQPFTGVGSGSGWYTAISTSSNRIIISNLSGIFYSTYKPETGLWNRPRIIPSTASGEYFLALTEDGSRGVGLLRNSFCYFFTWLPNTNNYSAPIQTLGASAGGFNWTGISMTSNGSRIFAILPAFIYYADWNGSNYTAWISTGIVGSASVTCFVACSGDGMRIVFCINSASVLSWALWNGYVYVVQPNTFGTVPAVIRSIRLNYNGSLVLHTTASSATGTARYSFWNGSGYSNSSLIPTSAIPASINGGGLSFSYDLKNIYVGHITSNINYQTSTDLKAPTQVSALTIPDTRAFIKSTGTFSQPFTMAASPIGISITQNGLRVVIANHNTGLLYFSTFNGSVWSALTQTLGTAFAASILISVKITADGSRGVCIARSGPGFAYFFTWNGANYSELTQTSGATSSTYQSIDMTTDGSRIFTVDAAFVKYADWNGTNYGTWTNTSFTGSVPQSAAVGCSTDGYRIVYCCNTTTLNYAAWNGASYVLQSTFGTVSLSNIRNIRFSYDGNYVFYSQYTASPFLFFSVWNGTTFGNSNSVPLAGITADAYPLAISYDLTNVYVGSYDVSVANRIYQVPITLTTVYPNMTGLTFSFWFKSIASPDYGGLITLQSIYGWILMYILGNTVYAAINEQKPVLPSAIYPTNITKNSIPVATIQQYTWNHIAWTIQQVNTNYDVSGAAIWSVYLNGNSVYQNTNQIYPYPGTRTTNFVGYNGQSNIFMNGNMDDYRAYNRVLSAKEINSIYVNSPNVTYEKTTSLPAGLESEVGGTYTFTAGDAIPTLTEYTTVYRDLSAVPIQNGAYVLSNSSNLGAGYYLFHSFDNNPSTFSHTASIYNGTTGVYGGSIFTNIQGVGNTSGEWYQIQIPYSLQVSSYIITNRNTNPERFPGTWYLVGSNNGADWYPIDYKVGITYTTDTVTFTPNQSNTNYYSYFRFVWIVVRNSINLVAIQFSGAARYSNYFYYNNGVKTYIPRLQSNYFTTWRLGMDPNRRYYVSTSHSNEGTILVTLYNPSVLYRSTDYGINWTQVALSGSDARQTALSVDGVNAVLCRPGPTTLQFSTTGGATWTAGVTSANWQYVGLSSTGQIAVFGTSGGAGNFYSTNGAVTVTAATGDLTADNNTTTCSSSGTYALSVYSGTFAIYRSTNGGATYTVSSSPVTNWNTCRIEDTGLAFASTIEGQLYRSTDFGVNWSTVASHPLERMSLAMSASGQYVITSTSQNIYLSTDYGVTFSFRAKNPIQNSQSIAMSRDGRIASITGSGQTVYIARL